MIIDSHCHLDYSNLYNQLDDVVKRAEQNKVKYLLSQNPTSYLDDVELLAQAHFNLGITYAKLNLYNQAEQEVLNALSLVPNKEYREVLNLIRNQSATAEP